MKASFALEGKQTPCTNPECRRIVKVPLQIKEKPKDWRRPDSGGLPSGAKRDDEPLNDAWGTGATGAVSREALEEAGAIPEVPETRGQKISRWSKRAAVAAVLIVGVWYGISLYRHNEMENGIDRTEELLAKLIDPQARAKDAELRKRFPDESTAEVFRALGEYYRRAGNPDQAIEMFAGSRGSIHSATAFPNEGDAVLLDLLDAIPELGGNREQIINRTHIKWEDVAKELQRTIAVCRAPEARSEAIRQLCRKLLANKQIDIATALRQLPLDEQPEAIAHLGLERFRAGQEKEAEAAAEQAQALMPRAIVTAKEEKRPAPIAPSLVALWILLKKPEKAEALKTGNDERAGYAQYLGSVEAQTILGELSTIRDWVKGLEAPDRVRFLVIMAAGSLDKDPKSTTDLDTLVTLAESFKGPVVDPNLAGKPDLSWYLWRAVRSAARAGHPEAAKKLVEGIADPSLKGRAQLELLRARLAKSSDKIPETAADEVDKATPAHAVALETIARHNARRGDFKLSSLKGWEEKDQPFGSVGVALGLQDKEKK